MESFKLSPGSLDVLTLNNYRELFDASEQSSLNKKRLLEEIPEVGEQFRDLVKLNNPQEKSIFFTETLKNLDGDPALSNTEAGLAALVLTEIPNRGLNKTFTGKINADRLDAHSGAIYDPEFKSDALRSFDIGVSNLYSAYSEAMKSKDLPD